MSYSYYLVHGLTLQAVALVWRKAGLSFSYSLLVLGFGATWVSASLLFFFVEKRFSLQPKSATTTKEPGTKSQMQSTQAVLQNSISSAD
jgi:peptidoglycan/LPS O-acetylase OafA/YrhL